MITFRLPDTGLCEIAKNKDVINDNYWLKNWGPFLYNGIEFDHFNSVAGQSVSYWADYTNIQFK